MPIQSVNPANGDVLRTFTPLTDEALLQKIAARPLPPFSSTPRSRSATAPSACASSRICWRPKPPNSPRSSPPRWASPSPSPAPRSSSAPVSAATTPTTPRASWRPNPSTSDANDAYVRWDPLGVILAVMPWNFPFWQVFRFLAPALMAGNVGLLKHASNVPQCALAIEALVRRAGFPRGTFQTLLIEASQVEMLLADDRVAAVTLTGSESAGRAIAAQAGWLIKKTVLELGGSDPFIVMPSADLELAVAAAVRARCINSGQSCIAAKRFLVADSIYDAFEKRFVAGMEALRSATPRAKTPRSARSLLAAQVDGSTPRCRPPSAGGRVLTGGERMVGKGNYYEPTVLAGVPRTAPSTAKRSSVPLPCSSACATSTRPSPLANDTPFGLGASVWTRSQAEQRRFAAGLQCGAVFVNAIVASDPRLPFGGVKHSGYGRELSAAGMREFLNAKTVVIAEPVAAKQPEAAPKPTSRATPIAPTANVPKLFRDVLIESAKSTE